MGTAYFVATEKEIDGYDATSMEGKMLAKLDGKLENDGFYAERGMKPLHEWCGDDMSDFFEELELDEMDPDSVAEKWFEPAEGLPVVRALIAHVRATPGLTKHQDIVLDDLAIFERVLLACQQNGVRWHLSIDI